MESGERHLGLELLRGIGAFGIVGCHLALLPMTKAAWMARALCDMNVCLFAALSGYFLADGELRRAKGGEEGLWTYILRRAKRLLPPYLIWSFAYIVLGRIFDIVVQHQLDPRLSTIDFWLTVLFAGNASTHLWFIVCLFYAQVLLKALTTAATFVNGFVWFFAGLAIVVWASNNSCWFEAYPLRLMGALTAGYGIRTTMGKRITPTSSFLGAGAVVCGVAAYYALHGVVRAFILDWGLAMLFLMVAASCKLHHRLDGLALFLGRTSLDVFLVHPLFAALLGIGFRKIASKPYGLAVFIADWVLVWAASLVFAWLLDAFRNSRKAHTLMVASPEDVPK